MYSKTAEDAAVMASAQIEANISTVPAFHEASEDHLGAFLVLLVCPVFLEAGALAVSADVENIEEAVSCALERHAWSACVLL